MRLLSVANKTSLRAPKGRSNLGSEIASSAFGLLAKTTRRVFLGAVSVTLLLMAVGCSPPRHFKESRIVMGTLCEVEVAGLPEKHARSAVRKAFRELHRVDRLMSNYKESSEVSSLNRWAAVREVRVSEHTFRVLQESLRFSEMTDGAFDVTVFPLGKLWGFFDGQGRVPSRSEIERVLTRVGWRSIQLDDKKRTVRFLRPGVEVDLGGAAKGYAGDLALKALQRAGVRNGLVNVGGNITALGSSSSRRGWIVGIRHPREEDVLGTLFLRNLSIATSGDYERYFERNGRRYSHVLNPSTGYPMESGVVGVSVLAATGLLSDLCSTSIYVGGEAVAKKLRKELGFLEYLIVSQKENDAFEYLQSLGMKNFLRLKPLLTR